MEAAREAAKYRAQSPIDSWVYRLVDNLDSYADSPICIQAYPVLKHSLRSFVYLDIHPTRWNRDPSSYGRIIEKRQLDNSSKAKVFFEKKALIKDYVRRKAAQHQIYQRKVTQAMQRLEYAQLKGDIPLPTYIATDWGQA